MIVGVLSALSSIGLVAPLSDELRSHALFPMGLAHSVPPSAWLGRVSTFVGWARTRSCCPFSISPSIHGVALHSELGMPLSVFVSGTSAEWLQLAARVGVDFSAEGFDADPRGVQARGDVESGPPSPGPQPFFFVVPSAPVYRCNKRSGRLGTCVAMSEGPDLLAHTHQGRCCWRGLGMISRTLSALLVILLSPASAAFPGVGCSSVRGPRFSLVPPGQACERRGS